jgi:hypothetical protein
MKIIAKKESKIVLYVFEDSQTIDVQDNQTVVGNPVEFYISDCNTSDTDLIESVTPPIDWVAEKYLYASGSWSLNPDWIDPDAPVES